MRKVTYGGATTLDGYFARADDTVDWLMWSDEAARIMADYWKNVDTILIGRKTYEVTQRMQSGKKKKATNAGGMKTYLFSRTLSESPLKGVTLVAGDGVECVRRLKSEPGKDICVLGGGALGASLLEGGVVDEVGFNIHPVLIGSGIPALPPMKRHVDLELVECERFKNGCVMVTYRVKRESRADVRLDGVTS
jgi:dihydrofolate reductase